MLEDEYVWVFHVPNGTTCQIPSPPMFSTNSWDLVFWAQVLNVFLC